MENVIVCKGKNGKLMKMFEDFLNKSLAWEDGLMI